MIRVAICDDMTVFLQSAKKMIQEWPNQPDDLWIELFEDGDSLLDAHGANPFDIIFLDVVMPLFNGIETAAEIRKHDKTVKIVFLTSSPEFAVESYTVKADNYLLKPVDRHRLFQYLDELYADIVDNTKCIAVRDLSAIHRVELRNIEYIEAQGKHVLFSLCDGSTIKATDPFYTYESQLLPEDGFLKCHRSYIVRVHRIDTYTQKEVKMHSGSLIPISRGYHKPFENAYFDLLFRKAGDR